jgi:hypothetical protein
LAATRLPNGQRRLDTGSCFSVVGHPAHSSRHWLA